MYPPELEIKDTTESNTSASYLDLLLSIGRHGQLDTSLYDKRDDFNFHITNFPFISSNIPSSPIYGVFISQLIRYARACSSYECFVLRAVRLSNKLLRQRYVKERLRSSLRKFGKGILSNKMNSPLPNITRHSGWWTSTVTLSIDQAFHQFLTLIARGFHRTFATGAACQQRTLTPPTTLSCPTLGLASVLMLRPISLELVLFPDFWVLNIPR